LCLFIYAYLPYKKKKKKKREQLILDKRSYIL